MKKIAVITDAISAEFFFPRWRRYYGGLFGAQHLHVVTYQGMKSRFADAEVGTVCELESPYNDRLRAHVIADSIAVLLQTYDAVLRCDVDEFLVPDPLRFSDLAEFVEKNELEYVTASGIDVVALEGDGPLDPDAPVLGRQRRYGVRSAALSKTCLTTIPLRWAAGFHAANVVPRFAGLFNFHLKFADGDSRIAWHEAMADHLPLETAEHSYFTAGRENLQPLLRFLASRPKAGVEDGGSFDERFLKTVRYNETDEIFQGDFISQDFLIQIDERFHERF